MKMINDKEITWLLKSFESLTLNELYEIMRLRIEVFVIEQDCPYQDADRRDQCSHHLLGMLGEDLVAYCRLVEPGALYNEVSIGRVITADVVRGKGVGVDLMKEGIAAAHDLYGKQGIRISAQSHLDKFYRSLGFRETGKEYLEDGIPHKEMLLSTD